MLYKDCFFIIGYRAVQEEQNAEVCKAVAQKILENMD